MLCGSDQRFSTAAAPGITIIKDPHELRYQECKISSILLKSVMWNYKLKEVTNRTNNVGDRLASPKLLSELLFY